MIEPELVRAKIAQAHDTLKRNRIDLWLVYLQETSIYREPVIDYVIGQEVTWQSAFLYTAAGESVAVVGNYDVDSFEARACFTRVLGYTQGIADTLCRELQRLDPRTIALNYAPDNPAADGLTHGLYLHLRDMLHSVGMSDRITDANAIVRSVRGRKTPEELRRIKEAVRRTEEVFKQLTSEQIVGLSEKQISARITELAVRMGSGLAFPNIVNAGTKSAVGHTHPTDATLGPGDLLHIDFGLTYQDFCADLQRCVYILEPGETEPPAELSRAFTAVAETIRQAFVKLRPGILGCDLDTEARRFIVSQGYPEYQHALGHQLGRSVHDGGSLLGPEWPRYGNSPRWPVEPGQVFTLELEAEVPGVGYASLEEDVVVTETGAEWLSVPQTEPAILPA